MKCFLGQHLTGCFSFIYSSSGNVGQLRHIYVATPAFDTLVVSILPKIQPAPVPCPLFLPTQDGPINLPSNGLWVLRLPYPLNKSQGSSDLRQSYNLPTGSVAMLYIKWGFAFF